MEVIPSLSRLLPQPLLPPRRSVYGTPRLTLRPVHISSSQHPRRPQLQSLRRLPRSAAQDNGDAPNKPEEESKSEDDSGREKSSEETEKSASSAVAELLAERKRREEEKPPGLLEGVAEEVREIEWPAFGRVLGTTGVVLAVIAGSSVALLTVNAILAEISDRVFAGKGVQDLF